MNKKSLSILLTNNTLAGRAGSELYLYDVAVELLKMGHKPIAYSNVQGQVAKELRAATVPVISDLKQLTIKPDIIHGQHMLDTMAALLFFNDTPGIYICHGWIPWQELPPLMSRIFHYIAVDETCRDRLVIEGYVPENKVTTLLNFVNLERFNTTANLNDKAKTALVFSNYAAKGSYVEAISQACQKRDIKLDIIGSSYNYESNNPEQILPNYDIVFAKAKSALEGIAVGNAVIVCDSSGLAEMVDRDNYESLRKLNFGIRSLQNAVSVDNILSEIDKYNAASSKKLSSIVRNDFCHKKIVHNLVSIYYQAINEYQSAGGTSIETELKEISENLIRHKKSIDKIILTPREIEEKNLELKKMISTQAELIEKLKVDVFEINRNNSNL